MIGIKCDMRIPEIKKTAEEFDRAQFNFEELLHIVTSEEVCNIYCKAIAIC